MNKKGFSVLNIFMPKVRVYLVLIMVLNLTIVYLKPTIWAYCLLASLAIMYYAYITSRLRKKEVVRCIEDLNFNMDIVTKDTLLNFTLPLIVIDNTGSIVWQNKLFETTFDNIEYKAVVDKVISKTTFDEKSAGSTGVISDNITINERVYSVKGNVIRTDDTKENSEILVMLYFMDETDYIELKEESENKELCIGMVVIDNYDDIIQTIDESEKSRILSEIDKVLNDWMKSIGGLINKLERDRYIITFEKQYLKQFEKDKFETLERVKELTDKKKMPVTLSIGISLDGDTLIDKFRSAITTIDLALGRGGDQAVIKQNGEYRFYGGRSKELEKRSRVRSRVMAFAIRELIEKSDNIIIVGHRNTDVDCIGAAMGLYRLATTLGKEAYILSDDENTSTKSLMDRVNKLKKYDDVFIDKSDVKKIKKEQTLIMMVDTHRASYLVYPELLDDFKNIVLIDHHRRGTDFIQDTLLSFHEIYASSTSELVTEILMYNDDVVLDITEAEALYAGILVDTKDFSFKTGVRTFEAAAYLKKVGVDIGEVKQIFQNDFETYSQIYEVVKSAEFIDKEIAISICPNSIKDKGLITAKAADELLTLSNIIASFVISKIDNRISISGRSTGDINVQVILEKLGGGGHLTFAGVQLENIDIEEAKAKLMVAIKEYQDTARSESV